MNTNGRYLCIRCPWEHLHTTQSDRTATVWFLAGSGGIEQSAFSCRHAHCAHRQTWEFLREIGYDTEGFEIIGPPVERAHRISDQRVLQGFPQRGVEHRSELSLLAKTDDQSHPSSIQSATSTPSSPPLRSPAPHERADSPAADHKADSERASVLTAFGAHVEPTRTRLDTHPLDLPLFERNQDTGKVKPKLPNIILALQRPDLVGAVIGWDEFKAEVVWRPWQTGLNWSPGTGSWSDPSVRAFKDADYVSLHLALAKLNFGPGAIATDLIRQSVSWIAEQRAFDSAITWLGRVPSWDGVHRIETFCSQYLGTEDTPYTRSVASYWWTAHIARILVPGVQADMAVVLLSGQGTRKTSLLKHMVPSMEQYVEIDLQERDDDLSRKMRGKLIGEMAELKGVSSRDIESIKAWISRQREEWVPKYQEFSRWFPRRLVLVGTTNNEEFLADETGNRRWLPMRVGRQAIERVVQDREQLWAEARSLYLAHGILWQGAERLAKDEHIDYMIHDEWENIVQDWLYAVDGLTGERRADREYLFMNDVLTEALGCEPHHATRATQLRIGAVMRKLGYLKAQRRVDVKNYKVWVKTNRV